MNKVETSIIIPVYNSEKNLAKLIQDLIFNLKKKTYIFEIILVDDNSEDSSWNIVKDFCSKNTFIKAVQLRKNVGQHNAIFAGLKYAIGKFIVTMDDDGQNSPNDIEKLIDKVKSGSDVSYANYKIKYHHLFRRFGSFLNNIVASFLFSKPVDLILTSFRCFNQDIKKEILKTRSSSIYIDGIIFSITKNVSNVYVEHKKREFGKSNYTLYKLVSLWMQMATGFSILPLRISSLLGFFFSISSFFVTIWFVFFRTVPSHIPQGWTSLIVVVIFFGGIQLLALGLIGEYLGRSYLTINNNIQYSEKKLINVKDEDNNSKSESL